MKLRFLIRRRRKSKDAIVFTIQTENNACTKQGRCPRSVAGAWLLGAGKPSASDVSIRPFPRASVATTCLGKKDELGGIRRLEMTVVNEAFVRLTAGQVFDAF
ncbi:hypothetical protein BHE74_00009509 [Ensete ventricosum]|uniref:Uncharacterized protein n=1 Tax=Ensete ventricosum TaxID=4639 RepID=A0A444FH73_ENSVE|nr:hypothetical protein GW17_00013855 [Ensete ventricosum]RWW82046.1 hypothetical protein BHE74_00009509 [Ensete ventricosum]RZR71237.1 hypothetical protein BHM03_00004223 [Ensete ventricosum]